MEITAIIGGIIAAAGGGLGLGAGLRLLPIAIRARRDLKSWKLSDEAKLHRRLAIDEEERKKLARPDGRKRDSSIVGLCDGALRHADGSYTCAWEAALAPTMLAHEHVVESRCDALARMLSVEKPPGTVVQFRYSSGPDPGRAILAHLKARGDGRLTHLHASELHMSGVTFYKAAAAAGAYRHQASSVWVRVPVQQNGDNTNSGL